MVSHVPHPISETDMEVSDLREEYFQMLECVLAFDLNIFSLECFQIFFC